MASALFKETNRYLSLDKIDRDNWAFKLFSKMTVGIFITSAAISVASSYSGKAIVCKDGNGKFKYGFDEQYCWLHGSRHLPRDYISDKINKDRECYADVSFDDPDPDTEYYIWVSMLLFLNGVLFMIPDKLWQYFEGGMVEQFGSSKKDFLDNPKNDKRQNEQAKKEIEKIVSQKNGKAINDNQGNEEKKIPKHLDGKHVEIFRNISKKNSRKYFFTFFACELLNCIVAILSFLFINVFLSGNFVTYGWDVINYHLYTTSYKYNAGKRDPMCSIFPTIVNCQTSFFSVIELKEERSKICILGQNILNQKIYFLLWLWFMVLFSTSVIIIINRIMCVFSPAYQRRVIASHIKSKNVGKLIWLEEIPQGYDYLGKWFILAQLGRNSCSYKYRNFIEKLVGESEKPHYKK